MTCLQEVTCPTCGLNHMTKAGHTKQGTQRYLCHSTDCLTKTFLLEYHYKACEPGIKEQVIDMAINGSGIRDTARVLKIDKNTVIRALVHFNA